KLDGLKPSSFMSEASMGRWERTEGCRAGIPACHPSFSVFSTSHRPPTSDLSRPLAFALAPRFGVFSENKQCLVIFYDGRLKLDGLKPSSFRNGRVAFPFRISFKTSF